MRQGYIISLWLFNVYMVAVIKEVKMGMKTRGGRLPGLLYADDLILRGESEENVRNFCC